MTPEFRFPPTDFLAVLEEVVLPVDVLRPGPPDVVFAPFVGAILMTRRWDDPLIVMLKRVLRSATVEFGYRSGALLNVEKAGWSLFRILDRTGECDGIPVSAIESLALLDTPF